MENVITPDLLVALIAIAVTIVGWFTTPWITYKIQQRSPNAAKPIVPLAPHTIANAQQLPETLGPFAGRTDYLTQLNQAWDDPDTHIFVLTAFGGSGKTALVHKWLSGFQKNPANERPYIWPFSDQGTQSQYEPSAAAFFTDALQHYDSAGTAIPYSDHDKGMQLAKLLKPKRQLMVLDGLEVMQRPKAQGGTLRDAGLKALLRELAQCHAGLILITSRQPIVEIQHDAGVVTQALEPLEEAEAIALFRRFRLRGRKTDFAQAHQAWQGHALALNLLANYLAEQTNRDIRQHNELVALWDFPQDEPQAQQAYRVLQAYERLFQNRAELALLYALGLFDQPIGADEITQVGKIHIQQLRPIRQLTAPQLRQTIRQLRQYGLLNSNVQRANPILDPDAIGYPLDTHPLTRKYFAYRFRTEYPAGWCLAHRTLYDYYRNLPDQEQPDTLEQMEPLFAAVRHACAGGWQQDALDKVYYPHIARRNEDYLRTKLGKVSRNLSVLSHFFTTPWNTPATELSHSAKAWVLSSAAGSLVALGRLQEAVAPHQAALAINMAQRDWQNAVAAACNLSQLQLTRGAIAEAKACAEQALEFTNMQQTDTPPAVTVRYTNEFNRMASHAVLTHVLNQQGDYAAAGAEFVLAEQLQQTRQPELPQLYALQGYDYCGWHLAAGAWQQAQQRATYALQIAQHSHHLLAIGLDQITLGRASLQQALAQVGPEQSPSHSDAVPLAPDAQLWLPAQQAQLTLTTEQRNKITTAWQRTQDCLDQAVVALHESNQEDQIPRGLLARAAANRYRSVLLPEQQAAAWAQAADDLRTVAEVAERCGMVLHLTDYHLEAARWALTWPEQMRSPDWAEPMGALSAAEHVHQAEDWMQQTGYGWPRSAVRHLHGCIARSAP